MATATQKLIWGAHALIGFCAAPTAPLVWAMYADTAHYSEWKWGRRATGLIFSAASFAQNFGWAIGGASTGWLLVYFVYVPNAAQSPHTVDGIVSGARRSKALPGPSPQAYWWTMPRQGCASPPLDPA